MLSSIMRPKLDDLEFATLKEIQFSLNLKKAAITASPLDPYFCYIFNENKEFHTVSNCKVTVLPSIV